MEDLFCRVIVILIIINNYLLNFNSIYLYFVYSDIIIQISTTFWKYAAYKQFLRFRQYSVRYFN